MLTSFILVALLTLPSSLGSGSPWNKDPVKWVLADVFQILQDSPWSLVGGKLKSNPTANPIDPQTGMLNGESANSTQAYGVQLSRAKQLPRILLLWWSSKTVRLAQQRLEQLLHPNQPAQPLRAEDLPDYVLVIQGEESLHVLRDAKEDLRDTVFLELPGGVTLDSTAVRFVDATEQEDQRVEFHFPKQIDGRPTLDPNADRVIFHCKASVKTPRLGHENTIALHAEFHPRAMRVHNLPDL